MFVCVCAFACKIVIFILVNSGHPIATGRGPKRSKFSTKISTMSYVAARISNLT